METLKNGAALIHDYADANTRCVIGHWGFGKGSEYVCWFMDTDGNCFHGLYFSYDADDEYAKVKALLRAVVAWNERIDESRAFSG